jgi:hypothetical protein
MGANDDVRVCERARIVGWWNCQCQRCREHAAANTIATPAAQPATDGAVGYQRIFNAIADAAKPRGNAISVSVIAFLKSLGVEAIYAAPHPSKPSAPDGGEQLPEHRYAKRLAESLWRAHYREVSPEWEVCPDLMGVLTQIDNMAAGLQCRSARVDDDAKDAARWRAYRDNKQTQYMLGVDSAEEADAAADAALAADEGNDRG